MPLSSSSSLNVSQQSADSAQQQQKQQIEQALAATKQFIHTTTKEKQKRLAAAAGHLVAAEAMTKMPDRHQHQSAATAQATAATGHNKRPSGEPLTGREQENPRKRARSTSPLTNSTSMHHHNHTSSTRISSTSPLLSTAAAAASSAAMVVTADVPTPSVAAATTGNLPHPPVHRDGHWKSVSQGKNINKIKLLEQNCKCHTI